MQTLDARRMPLRHTPHMPWRRKVAEIIAPVSPSTGQDDLETWILARIAEALEADPLALDPLQPPSVYGFEAPAGRALTRELGQRLGCDLPDDIFGSGRSVRTVARSLCTVTRMCTTMLPLTREAMRGLVLARAARVPRRPLASLGVGPRTGPAGCSPGEQARIHPFDLALAS